MIEAELPGLGVAYRSRPAVVRATSAPLAWFGRARVAALLLVAGAVLPWSIVMIRSPWRLANLVRSGTRAIVPSSFMISQMTPAA